jgi:histidinol phosphatase-like enzyme
VTGCETHPRNRVVQTVFVDRDGVLNEKMSEGSMWLQLRATLAIPHVQITGQATPDLKRSLNRVPIQD